MLVVVLVGICVVAYFFEKSKRTAERPAGTIERPVSCPYCGTPAVALNYQDFACKGCGQAIHAMTPAELGKAARRGNAGEGLKAFGNLFMALGGLLLLAPFVLLALFLLGVFK